jgi:hypothetical protein
MQAAGGRAGQAALALADTASEGGVDAAQRGDGVGTLLGAAMVIAPGPNSGGLGGKQFRGPLPEAVGPHTRFRTDGSGSVTH